jgi:hypothetical protein
VDAADADVDAVDEIIDTRVDDNVQPVAHGLEATLALFIIFDGATGADVSLWYRGNDEEEEGDDSSSSPSGAAGNWCRYAVATGLSVNTMLVYSGVPAGEWKLVVDALTGASLTIREAHST